MTYTELNGLIKIKSALTEKQREALYEMPYISIDANDGTVHPAKMVFDWKQMDSEVAEWIEESTDYRISDEGNDAWVFVGNDNEKLDEEQMEVLREAKIVE